MILTVKNPSFREQRLEVSFSISINDKIADVKGSYKLLEDEFYPELIDVFSLEQYAVDIAKVEPKDLYESLQKSFKNRSK